MIIIVGVYLYSRAYTAIPEGMTPKDTSTSHGTRRSFVKEAVGVSAVGLAGCLGGDDGGDGSRTIGFETMGLGGDPWMGAFTNAAEWYAEDNDINIDVSSGQFDSAKQIQDLRQMIRQDVDGIVISPFEPGALAGVIEEAVDEGIPVFTANSTASTDAVSMFTAFGNANAASSAAELMISRLEDRYGEARGEVLEIVAPQRNPTFVDRHEGFENRIQEEDNVEIIEQIQVEESDQASITNKLSTRLQQGTDFDGLYCPDLNSELGTLAAMENTGTRVERGEDGHIIMTGIDAGPNVLSAIQDGYMDGSVDQPNLFYGPISIKYLVDYLEADDGASALPEIGTEMTVDDLDIQGGTHRGVDPWEEPIWAPATVTEYEAGDATQRYFQTQGVTVTQENADIPYIWGNIMH